MLFLNSILLAGLAGAMIPVILHLIRRQAAKPMDWGAMRFLFDTVAMRRRRMEWEDLLLMVTRCLLLALIALAVARPFVPPNSAVPWLVVIPLVLLGMAAFGGSFTLSGRKSRWLLRLTGLLCLLATAAAIIMERELNLKRFKLASGRDVALIIDASSSMTLTDGTSPNSFTQAVEEAKEVVKQAPRGTAFTIILGGPAPELKTATPLTHRADVLEVLEQVQAVGGPFRAQDAISMATLSLADGENANKEILVFSDGQRIGWRTDNPSAWSSLGDVLSSMPQAPRLLMRQLPPPQILRNVAIADISLSRELVGTDRPLGIKVMVENTGTETITPGELSLHIGKQSLEAQGVGQLIPGQQETIHFQHQFKQTGAQLIHARIDTADAIPGDNHREQVVNVRESLPVLLIDGHPSGAFFERAASFTALALTPNSQPLKSGKSTSGFLMDPRVVPAPEMGTLDKLPRRGVIVLADVPRLPSDLARKVESFVASGGGLLILAGSRADASFYNTWQGASGPVSPKQLAAASGTKEEVSPAPDTFDHPALDLFSRDKKSDLKQANISQFRKVQAHVSQSANQHVIARFSNGAPWLMSKQHGQGRVMLASCRFDRFSGTLPSRESFVPFIHEIITWLAGTGDIQFNLPARWSPRISLPGGSGLLASYYEQTSMQGSPLSRQIHSVVDLNDSPRQDQATTEAKARGIRWHGRLLPPSSGEYKITIEGRGKYSLSLDGKQLFSNGQKSEASANINLSAGQAVPLQLDFSKTGNPPSLRLLWTPPGAPSSLIPPEALLPPRDPDSGSDLVLEKTTAIDPLGVQRSSTLTLGARGPSLNIECPAIPGLYQIVVPPTAAQLLNQQAGTTMPMVVRRDIEESRYEALNDDDTTLISKHIETIPLRNQDDILAVLNGKGFGEELWKVFAIGALVLLVLEVALTRWISKSRRAGEEVKIDFAIEADPHNPLVQPSGSLGKAVNGKGDLP
ncbi:VWA domain-containing protein [Verrucomicrobiaceae bacterium N1E253]|uniref:VWA domain-containing protein n=1 Tax=Oceaniferula marina TaxID=2748318 RepID=A0A851GEW5_9BACT|nr:PA14 domain-containing protein [Oceaniferula marina]NWK55729.1 VWA domain-containing protein [Oceaniferula marina]